MPDTLGGIPVPTLTPSEVFPIPPAYPHGRALDPEVYIHTFESGNAKVEQRFLAGNGSRRFRVRCLLNNPRRVLLRDFWEDIGGAAGVFYYDAPNDDGGGATRYVCRFEDQSITFDFLNDALSTVGLVLAEVPQEFPSYDIAATVSRFPDAGLQETLLAQEQEIFPLIRIRVTDPSVEDIYISDRRATVGGQLYQARLLDWDGIGQGMNGEADEVSFVLGNADRVLTALANATDLYRAALEFSLFHATSLTKIDLWRGHITDWSFDEGPQFTIRANDGLYELTLLYPKTISRTCPNPFNDGVRCVFDGVVDLTHFPGASLTSCDKGFDTPNGCQAHMAERYFGGVVARPQGVKLKGEGGGYNLTATSIVADTLYGAVLPDIWHNDDGYPERGMPVKCMLAAARDEDQFFAALGVVGAGPLSAFTVPQNINTPDGGTRYLGPLLDNQPHHGFPTDNSMGLRRALGTVPAGASDYFSLGEVGDTVASKGANAWKHIFDGSSTFERILAAGLAFQEVRRVDAHGIQLLKLAEHSVDTLVSKGLRGLVWSAPPGARSGEEGLTNPIWVAINTYLRALGLWQDAVPAATQEALFDVVAAIDAATDQCDAIVPAIIGGGSEKQFRFMGSLAEQKPLRDWLTEILANCLGYYTWNFGKLRVGVRFHSGATEAFTAGNILLGSLALTPLKPAFNHLTVQFADIEYGFAGNSVEYYDLDHATRIGNTGAPLFLKSTLNLVGAATKSQAARIAITRLREELGGATPEEQRKARNIAFKTTILALNTEPGKVCSLTHPDMPDGYGEFRVTSWKLNRDFSIDISGRTTTDKMYDYTFGTKPADVPAEAFPSDPGGDVGPPGVLTFTPALYEYGWFSVENCAVATANTRSLQGLCVNLVYVDELTSDVWVELADGIDAVTDPVAVAVLENPDRVTPPEELDFAVGDWVLFNHTGNYEIAQLTGKVGNSWTLARHWPGTPEGNATFGSLMAAHPAGTRIYKAQVRPFTFDSRAGNWNTANGIAPRFDMNLPSACVLAVVAAVYNYFGYSLWTVYNCALAEVPGMRTCDGGTFTFQRAGVLAVLDRAGISKYVPYKSSLRVLYARLETAPAGGDVQIKVQRSRDNGGTWDDLQTLTIPAGMKTSYQEGDPPVSHRLPYNMQWPCPVLYPDDLLNYAITQIGESTPGADLTVEVAT